MTLLALAAASAAYPASLPDTFWRARPVEVAEAGWIRVPLETRVALRGHAGRTWRVLGPDGQPVALLLLTPPEGEVPVRARGVEERPEGWRLVFDLGPTPVRHDRLRVVAARRSAARGCWLEGSRDLTAWRAIAHGDLFRLGEAEGLQRSALEYAATDERFLRLAWPRGAGFPELVEVWVRALPPPPESLAAIPVGVRLERASSLGASYRLDLPAPRMPVVRVDLRLQGSGAAGARLFAPSVNGDWSLLAERGLDGAGAGPGASLHLSGGPLESDLLRLELHAAEGPADRLESAAVVLAPLWLLFRAGKPGRYMLAYGGSEADRPAPDPISPDSVAGPVIDARPGAEETLPLPAGALRAALPAALDDGLRVRRAWPLDAGSTRAGSVARLELTEALYEELGEDPWRLRILAGDRVVPHLQEQPRDPALLLEREDLAPASAEATDRRRVKIELPASTRHLVGVEALTAARDFQCLVQLELTEALRPGVEPRRSSWSGTRGWSCDGDRALPCRLAFDGAHAGAARTLQLTLVRRSGALPERIAVRAWRRRHVLVFVWPEGESELRLVLVSRSEHPPHPALETFREPLLEAPWTGVGPEAGASSGAAAGGKGGRPWLIAALALAGIALVAVLARSILAARRDGASGTGGEVGGGPGGDG